MQGSVEETPHGGIIMNHDLISNMDYSRVSNSIDNSGTGAKHRKHSVPYPGNNLPMVKGVLGSGVTLNNPNTKRSLNNTVTIKTGLEVRNMANQNSTPKQGPPNQRQDSPENERDSQPATPPRNENTLTPMNRSSTKKAYGTKLPQI